MRSQKMGAKERPPPLPPEGVSLNSTIQKVKAKIKKDDRRDVKSLLGGRNQKRSRQELVQKRRHGAIQTANKHHLSRFNITDDPATCRLCTNGVQDKAHLFEFAKLLEDNADALIQQITHEEAEAF
jgi:hypothetical protein